MLQELLGTSTKEFFPEHINNSNGSKVLSQVIYKSTETYTNYQIALKGAFA